MKIICIGRNYVKHALELNNEIPGEPVFFLKPDTALLPKGQAFYIPSFSSDIHHEIEIVLRICKEGKNISEEFASRYYDSVTVGIDFTARDIQQRQKEKGLPWEPAKAFDHSAPVGNVIKLGELKDRKNILFHLDVNGKTVQKGSSELMINSFEKIISYVSKFITLRKSDLIFTGSSLSAVIIAITSPTLTTCPSENKHFDNIPEAGDGTSVSTLSVAISRMDSSASIRSPSFFNHLRIVASATLSPILGMISLTIRIIF
jgi:hypothetical protein